MWQLLNSPIVIALLLTLLGYLYLEAKRRWPWLEKYEGLLTQLIREAEKVCEGSPGKEKLKWVLTEFEARVLKPAGKALTDTQKTEVEGFVSILHNQIFPKGSIGPASTLAAIAEAVKKALPMSLLLALPFLAGCLQAGPKVLQGHDTAASCVAKADSNYKDAIRGLSQALRDERKSNVEVAMGEMFAMIRAEAITKPCEKCAATGAVDGKPCPTCEGAKTITLIPAASLGRIKKAIENRDVQLVEIEKTIAKYQATAALGDREAGLALGFMGQLRAYDAAGVDPVKVSGQVSEVIPGPWIPGKDGGK